MRISPVFFASLRSLSPCVGPSIALAAAILACSAGDARAGTHAPGHSGSPPAVCNRIENGHAVFGRVGHAWPSMPSAEGTFRAVVVQHKQSPAAAQSYESWAEDLEQSMNDAAPSFRSDTPTVVVFGEFVGLTSAFIGSRGAFARSASTVTQSLGMLAYSYWDSISIYMQCYPELPVVNALELAMADTMWRAFYETFSRLAREHGVYVVASTFAPQIQISHARPDLLAFGDPDLPAQEVVYMPVGKEVYDAAFLFDPNGDIVGVTRKVRLTPVERFLLGLTPGDLDDVDVFQTPMGRLGIATCQDAYFHDYRSRLDALGASVVAQPSFTGPWAGDPSFWLPQDWVNASLGLVQAQYPNIHYNLNAGLVGNLFDQVLDGQSAILRKSDQPPASHYIGLDSSGGYNAEIVALAPWATPDPGIESPSLSLLERRQILRQYGLELAPGSGSPLQNGYVETALAADLEIIP